jgi:hypothetical protein
LREAGPYPRWLRWALTSFVVLLVLGGIPFFLEVEENFPWRISREASIVYGCAFLAAAVNTVYAVLRPSRSLVRGLSLGYLLYSAVLVVPFLSRANTVLPERLPAYYVWLFVIIYFGLVPAWYLLSIQAGRSREKTLARPARMG